MSATDFPPRCKDKNYLAKNVHVSRIFFAKVRIFSEISVSCHYFLIEIPPYLHLNV